MDIQGEAQGESMRRTQDVRLHQSSPRNIFKKIKHKKHYVYVFNVFIDGVYLIANQMVLISQAMQSLWKVENRGDLSRLKFQ